MRPHSYETALRFQSKNDLGPNSNIMDTSPNNIRYPLSMLWLLTACSPAVIDSLDSDDTPSNIDSAESTDSGSIVYEDDGTFRSTLPIVRIDTRDVQVDHDELWDDDGRAWTTVDVAFIDTDSTGHSQWTAPPSFDGQAGLHIRGNSSAWEYEKKSYALETRDSSNEDLDVSLLGLPEEEDWILHGPFSDKTLMRNVLMYDWSRSIGRYAARTRFVELFIEADGEDLGEEDYHGVYVLMEKIKRDKNRVDISKIDAKDNAEPDISGGYLFKRDWLEEPEAIVRTDLYGDQILLIDPDPDQVTDLQLEWITDYLNGFEAALAGEQFEDPDIGYAAWIDVDSFIDHMLLVELGRNVDGYVLSTWLYKDRESKLSMGPVWDYNGALGNADYFESWDPEGWHYQNPEFPADNPRGFRWYERLLEDPNFRTKRAERWAEHRLEALSNDSLMESIDAYANLLQNPAERNFERWEILGEYVWPNDWGYSDRHSHADEVDYLKTWILQRVAWMDDAVQQ